ncbi:MAG TPA: heavy-metal-associated domain-containing protein [Firmicutes bacterium]|nr:heavy-metal-associated domain-containing protein [Bacillota bacterium]
MNPTVSRPDHEDILVLRIEGMSCNHCRAAVERALLKVPGVKTAQVDLASGTARVTFDPHKATRDDMVRAVEDEGYRVPL